MPEIATDATLELEAKLIAQEHRLTEIARNFFIRRKTYSEGDPRRDACTEALIWRICWSLLTPAAATTAGLTGIAALLISLYTLYLHGDQNKIETRAGLFAHALEIQNVLVDKPELYPYFYKNKTLPVDLNEEQRIQIAVVSEMLADMLDHAAASFLIHEGWEQYAQDMYESSPAFRQFANERKDWYPSMWRWIKEP